MSFGLKTFLSILLSFFLMAGSYGAMGQRLMREENQNPQDNTNFNPVNFRWNGMSNKGNEDNGFIAGKYVRNDGNAVLYIDYEASQEEFVFELFVKETRESDEHKLAGTASISRGLAYYFDEDSPDYEGLEFYSHGRGVVEIYGIPNYLLSDVDGTYFIARAKYIETPSPNVINDTSTGRGSNNDGNNQGQNDGTQTPSDPTGNEPPNDGPQPPQPGTQDTGGDPYDPDDPVGTPAQIRGDGPDKTDKDIIPKTAGAHDDFEKINDITKTPMNTDDIATVLQAEHWRFTGESMVRWDYKLDRDTFSRFYREGGGLNSDQINAMLNFSERGGYIGDLQKVVAEFVFGSDVLVKFNMSEGPEHVYEDRYILNKMSFRLEDEPIAIRDLIWDSTNGYMSATMYHRNDIESKTLSISLRFGRLPDGTVIAQGWCFAADEATTRSIHSIYLTGERLS